MTSSFFMRTFTIGAVTASVFLGGCLSSLIPEPAPADVVYRLSDMGDQTVPSDSAIVVRIDRPSASDVLSGRGIVVSPDGIRLATAGMARWSEPIPTLVQNSFFDALSTRRDIVGVLPTSGAKTTHRAHLTIRNFEARFDRGELSAPMIIVQYTATVSNASSRELIGTYDVRKKVRADAASVSAIVAAMSDANKSAMSDLVSWIAELAPKTEA